MNLQPLMYGGYSKVIANGNKFKVAFNVESRCCIFDSVGNMVEEYLSCETCRTEHVFGNYPLFTAAPFAFTPVFGKNSGVIFRRGRAVEHPLKRDTKYDNTLLNEYEIKLRNNDRMVKIDSLADVVEHALKPCKVTARTKIAMQNGLHAVIEYPIRTINISEKSNMVQVDTGPAIVPIAQDWKHVVDSLMLAYIAFFEPNKASFIVDNEVAECGCRDYALNVVADAENELWCEIV